MTAPKNDVVTDQLGDHVQQSGIARQLQKRLAAPHPFWIAPFDVDTHQLLRAHAGIFGQHPIQRLAQRAQPVARQAVVGHQNAIPLVSGDVRFAQSGHGCCLLCNGL